MYDIITQNSFLISQILVGIAIFTDFLSFQFKDRKKVLLILTISAFLITIHYYFLGELNAFYLMVISTISFVVSIYTHNKYIMMIFGILYIFPIVLNYNSSIDLIIFIGLYIALVAKFMKNDKYLRLLIMLASVFFISYNLLVFTPGGVLLEIIFLGSNLLGYYKYYIKKDKELLDKEYLN